MSRLPILGAIGLLALFLCLSRSQEPHSRFPASTPADAPVDCAKFFGLLNTTSSDMHPERNPLGSQDLKRIEALKRIEQGINSGEIPATCRDELIESVQSILRINVRTGTEIDGAPSHIRAPDTYSILFSRYETRFTEFYRLGSLNPCFGSARDAWYQSHYGVNYSPDWNPPQDFVAPTPLDFDMGSAGCVQSARAKFEDSIEEASKSGAGLEKLSRQLGFYTDPISTTQVRALLAYQHLMKSESENELYENIKANRDGLNQDEFLGVVQIIGARLLRDYSDTRNKNTFTKVQGVVTGDQMLKAAQHNAAQGDASYYQFYDKDIPKDTYVEGGICRDIAAFQAKILDAGGFKNTLVIGNAVDVGSFHARVMAEDPSVKGKLYQFDYEALTRIQGADGARALYEGNWDVGNSYFLFDGKTGRMIGATPSEQGMFLARASGHDPSLLDPHATSHGSFISMDVPIGKSENVQGAQTTFIGRDGNGGEYAGLAGRVRYGSPDKSNGSVGIVLAVRQRTSKVLIPRPSPYIGNAKTDLMLYLHWQQMIRGRNFALNRYVVTHTEGVITLSGMLSTTFENKPDAEAQDVTPQLDFRAQLAQVFETSEAASTRVHAKLQIGAQILPGLGDVRNNDYLQVPILVVSAGFARLSTEIKLSEKIQLLAQALVTSSALGHRARVELGLGGEQGMVSVAVSGRLTESTSLALEESLRWLSVQARLSPVPNIDLGASVEIPLEKGPVSTPVRVFGNAGVRF